MDFAHGLLLGLIVGVIAASTVASTVIIVLRLLGLGRMVEKDEAIDAATFLALRELRERFEPSRQSLGR